MAVRFSTGARELSSACGPSVALHSLSLVEDGVGVKRPEREGDRVAPLPLPPPHAPSYRAKGHYCTECVECGKVPGAYLAQNTGCLTGRILALSQIAATATRCQAV